MADRTGADDLVLAALAAGQTLGDAAKASGVAERTVRRRMADPAFLQRLATLRASAMEEAASRLTSKATAAVDRLGELMHSFDSRVALGACRAVLEHVVKLREATDISRRLTELEAQVNNQEAA